MIRLKAMWRTTAVRLSLLYLALFAISAIALLYYVTSISEGLLTDQTRGAINNEMRIARGAYRKGGINDLLRHIDRRSRQPGANLYIIATPSGEIFAGNVDAIAPGVLDKQGRIDQPFEYRRFGETDHRLKYRALARVVFLANGFRLLVGRDLGEPERFSGLIERALIMALAIMGVGALAIWFFVGRKALKRIDGMSFATEKIMGGDLTQRLPVMGSGDEFDRLSLSLNAMLERIEQLNEGLRQVSDNIAHDLKTPLTRLRNRAEATLASQASNDEYRAALEDMIGESDQLISIFSALLMISRVEAGSSAAQLSDVDLSAIVNDAIELYEPVAEDENIILQGNITTNIHIHGNRELIGQTMSNLIDNAIKYASRMDEDPNSSNAKINVHLNQKGQNIYLKIADNGTGIPMEKYNHVIKRFVRLDKSRNKPGTGLGLSMVDAVMRMHGGKMELSQTNPDDAEFKGLTVTLSFPSQS